MSPNLERRLGRLEGAATASPRHEDVLRALARLETPPAGYTPDQQARDEALLQPDSEALIAAGLA